MDRLRILVAALLSLATSALAQYPARGQPDPSFNGGRPRLVDLTNSTTGYDVGTYIVPLTGTRFAVIGTRPDAATDVVLIIDTVPERVTTFDPALDANTLSRLVQTLSVVDETTLLVGGFEELPQGQNQAWLELREVGVGATPQFTLRAALRTSGNRTVSTTGAASLKVAGGELRVWQVRGGPTSCSSTTLHRLDIVAAAVTERYFIDVGTALALDCYSPAFAFTAPARPTDAPGSTAIIVGGTCTQSLRDAVCVTRVLDTGGMLAIDRSYGTQGLAVYSEGPGVDVTLTEMKLDAVGRAVVSAIKLDGAQSGLLIRFDVNGHPDVSLSANGSVPIPSPVDAGARALGVAVTPEERILVAGSSNQGQGSAPFLYYYDPADSSGSFEWVVLTTQYGSFTSVAPLPAGGALAVGGAFPSFDKGHTLIARLAGNRQTVDVLEYFNAGFDHYFVASVPDEIRKLDDGTFVGWQRTGQSFAVLPLGATGAADVCRFFSTKFGARSSHFYTPIASECGGLKLGDTWGYEGLVFALSLPTGNGVCPLGTRPLYRLYNDGQGAAPNHRYTVSDALRLAQVGHGWIGEGIGSPPVFACVVV